MRTLTFKRVCQVLGVIGAIAIALLLLGTATGRNTLGWIYLRSSEAMTNALHMPRFPLDRF
jgi:hypothetical protein